MSPFEFRGPSVNGLYDLHHFQNRAGNLWRFFFSSNSPGGMGIAEGSDLELRYPGLCPHYRMGRPVGHDGTVGLNAVGQEMMRPRSFATVGAGLELIGLEVSRPSLEDVYLALTSEEAEAGAA